MRRVLTSLLLVISSACFAQLTADDLASIKNHQVASQLPDMSYEDFDKQPVKFYNAINPVYWVYKGGLKFYQAHISTQLSTSCIYHTSCSRFGKQLFEEYNVFKAFFLTADRVSRCNRITRAEASPLSFSPQGKIIEEVSDYSFRNR